MESENDPLGAAAERRVRDRLVETLDMLASGAEGLRAYGPVVFLSEFLDLSAEDSVEHWRLWGIVDEAGDVALEAVRTACLGARAAWSVIDDDDMLDEGWVNRFAGSPWPARIALRAGQARKHLG